MENCPASCCLGSRTLYQAIDVEYLQPAPTMRRREFLTAVATLSLTPRGVARPAPAWKAGVAAVDITPDRSLWMAGFAARTQPSQGVALPLHAKALALQAGDHRTAVLVTVDLLGVTA